MAKKKKDFEVITKTRKAKCWVCNGKGCKTCKGSGIYKEKSYILIYKNQAFGVDTLK